MTYGHMRVKSLWPKNEGIVVVPRPEPTLATMAAELDITYRAVAARLPDNPAVRFETAGDKQELVLSPLDKLDEPASLIALRTANTPTPSGSSMYCAMCSRSRSFTCWRWICKTCCRWKNSATI